MQTLKLLLILLIAPLCFAQPIQSTIIPPCTLNFTFNATHLTSANLSNQQIGCDKFTLTVYNAGFGSFTVTLQSALAATTSTPGTFGTYTGTTVTGSNPLTTTGIATFTNGTVATPWLRVVFTGTGSGTVYGVLQGSQTVISKGGGSGGGGNLTIAGTANQIDVTGAGCTPTNSGTCTISADTNLFAGCTFAAGALTCPGSITSGSGSGVAGIFDLAQGTAPSIPANSFGFVAPTAITTSQYLQPPNAVPSAHSSLIVSAPTGNVSPFAYKVIPDCQDSGGNHLNFTQSTDAYSCGTTGGGGGGSAGATLFSTTNSTAVTATSPTTLIGTVTGSTTVPANTFTAGQILEFVAQGFYTTPATPASLTITLNIGGTIRLTTGAVVQIASITNGTWRMRCAITTRTTGGSGTQIANCIFEGTGATLTPGESAMQTSSTWTIDTTATQAIDFVATWSTATGAPTITSTNVAAWIPGAPVTSVNSQTGAVSLFTTNAQTSTYQVLAADFVGCKTIPVASGTFTITLVASGAQPPSGQCLTILNYGTGVVTLARSGQNINGAAANLTGTAGSATAPTGWYVVSDGTNYVAEVLGGSSGGGTTVTAAPPYITIGATTYVQWDLATATKPTAPTFLNAVTCSSATTGTNGDLIEQNTTAINCFGGYAATASVEADYNQLPGTLTTAGVGIWIWDSTNSNLYELNASSGAVVINKWSYNGSGNPSFSSQPFSAASSSQPCHVKISVSAGTASFSSSGNGGLSFSVFTTIGSIGTISKAGFVITGIGALDLSSLVII